MSVEEMKKEINQKMDSLNEAQLRELDAFINKINGHTGNEWDLSRHVENIVNEREEVLKKLAE